MKAVVKITAYDYAIYGGLDGELLDISPDSFQDERGQIYFAPAFVRLKTSSPPEAGKTCPSRLVC
ncbi:MAG: hypothetical protein H6863_02290 [Rhodospirillales bacterium]|nr:hypothetical protein [Rhodospirillales bacterium]